MTNLTKTQKLNWDKSGFYCIFYIFSQKFPNLASMPKFLRHLVWFSLIMKISPKIHYFHNQIFAVPKSTWIGLNLSFWVDSRFFKFRPTCRFCIEKFTHFLTSLQNKLCNFVYLFLQTKQRKEKWYIYNGLYERTGAMVTKISLTDKKKKII